MLMTRELDEKILSVMARALDHFGANVSRVVFFKFEHETGLTRSDILPKNLDKFEYCIYSIFGTGHSLVEARISNELRKEFGIEEDLDARLSFDLADIVGEVRNLVIKSEIAKKNPFSHIPWISSPFKNVPGF
jgi:hypothetical protein